MTVATPSGTPSPRAGRVLALVIAVLVVLAGAAFIKVDRHHEPSHVSASSSFVPKGTKATGSGASTTTQPAGLGSSTVAPSDTTTSAVPTSTTSVPGPTTTAPAANHGAQTTTTTVASLTSAGVTPAASGTYTYTLVGSEGASGFGNRAFPSRMTIKVHGASGVDPRTQAVFDVSLSPSHSEREVVGWGPDGVSWLSEGSQVQFGSLTGTSQDTYSPPMLQIPAQLLAAKVVTGASDVLSGGALVRVEDWKVSVVGSETIVIGGRATPTVKVQVARTSRTGGNQDTTRTTTYWYSPTTRMWVALAETIHGQQGLTSTYDASFAATLVGYSPG